VDKHTLAHTQAGETATFGFWVYLMTDCVLFATLFATYAVLHNNTNGGLSAHQLFDLPYVLRETIVLLVSSFTCGLAVLAAHKGNRAATLGWFTVTLVLGLAFLGMELSEFRHLVVEGNGWNRSGFLSAYFTLLATHGLHIAVGSLWMFILMARIWAQGVTSSLLRRLTSLSLFWHFLDIVWIFLFTIVYLIGAR
jgi:cytochrome o ubiquinol oxidase subunit 3